MFQKRSREFSKLVVNKFFRKCAKQCVFMTVLCEWCGRNELNKSVSIGFLCQTLQGKRQNAVHIRYIQHSAQFSSCQFLSNFEWILNMELRIQIGLLSSFFPHHSQKTFINTHSFVHFLKKTLSLQALRIHEALVFLIIHKVFGYCCSKVFLAPIMQIEGFKLKMGEN